MAKKVGLMTNHIGKNGIIEPYEIITWVVIIFLLYIISRSNYLLFHSLAELFSIFVAYVIFLIVMKSRARLENRFLIFVGIAYFFVASLDLLHTFAYKGLGIFPQFDANLPTQLWITARYMESISLLIAPLLLIDIRAKEAKKYTESIEKSKFFSLVFLIYTGITVACILSIFIFRNFPDSYIEGSGLTSFKVISEYIICFILSLSLVTLYSRKEGFNERVFGLIAASIVITILEELAFTLYVDVYGFFNLIGHCLKILSFYLIYKAIIETGFDDPYTLLFRELKQSEEAFRQESIFLREDQGFIYNMLGIKKNKPYTELTVIGSQIEKDQSPLIQDIHGFIGFRINENSEIVFIGGSIEEITGYNKGDFLSQNVKWMDLVLPEYQPLIFDIIEKAMSNPNTSIELEYQIQDKNKEIKWVREVIQKIPAGSITRGKMQGFIRDITERKMAEKALIMFDEARIKEIHHRIKNNLQVISSLLSLEAERFSDIKVLNAFKESQNRVASMALIHEELYKGKEANSLDFAAYLQKLTEEILNTYNFGTNCINLKLDLDQIYLGMDIAIPLGIIVNELVSNSLKHAFPDGMIGEIQIDLHEAETYVSRSDISCADGYCLEKNGFDYILEVWDNGKGIPEEMDIESLNSLGLQLVNILVDQIDGYLELKRGKGTEFTIFFSAIEK